MGWWFAVGLWGCGDGKEERSCADTPEVPYDGIDQNCDGEDLIDVDGDGYPGVGDVDFDCDDAEPTVHPDAPEVPYDGVDQNCFEGDLVDVDGDGEPGADAGGDDCNDEDDRVRPDATDQVGDGIDLNCDGVDGVDRDGDGWPSIDSRGTDCNDEQSSVYPGATEVWYDGLDQDCAGDCDYDQDGDGAVLPGAPIVDESACDQAPGTSVGAPTDCNDENSLVGQIDVVSVTPVDGALQIPVDTTVTVVLSDADPTATLTVRDEAGAVVPGNVSSADDATFTWSGSADLDGGATYTVQFQYGCAPVETAFTTEYPAVAVDPSSLVGRVWDVDLVNATLTEPVNSAGLFAAFLDHTLRFEVLGVTGADLSLRVAPAVAGAQNLCFPTTDSGSDFSGNPDLSVGPGDWSYFADPLPFDLLGATLSASVRGGGDLLVGATVEALVDTRPMVLPWFGPGKPDDEVCTQVATFGDACVACPDGSGAFCLAFRFEDAPTIDVGGSLTVRTPADIAGDVGC